MEIKKKIFLIIALLYIIYTVFPLFADTFHIPVWLPSMLTFGIMIFMYPRAFANSTFFWFVIYWGILELYVILERPLTINIGTVQDSKQLLIEAAFILPSLSIFSILLFLDDYQLSKKLVLWSVFIILGSFIAIIPLLQKYSSVRDALIEEAYEGTTVPGLPSYALMHAYTVLLPAGIYVVKSSHNLLKLVSIVGILILCFVIYDTFVTTSLILMIGVIIFSLIYSDKSRALSVILFLSLGLIILVLYREGSFIKLIDKIMPLFEQTPVEDKLNDFKESMIQGHATGGTITVRQSHHRVSLDSFAQAPLFGTSQVGGHSSILDRLGGMGLIVGVPYILIFISVISKVFHLLRTNMAKTFYFVSIVVCCVFLSFKGLWGSEGWLMFMVMMPYIIIIAERFIQNSYEKA